jgi:AcrR family transcriptional regulator
MTKKPINKGGRPPYEPTEKDRRVVESMIAYGITTQEVARVIGISPHTLYKYFRDEMETSAVKANSKVAETAYQMPISGKCPAATFFWLKCRAHWRETTDVRLTGDPNNPLEVVTRIERVIIDAHEDVADPDPAGLPTAH